MNTLLRRISIRSRLLGSMLLVSALLLGLGGWASLSYSTLQRQTDELLQAQSRANRDSSLVLAALERVQRHEQSVMLNGNNTVEAAEHKARWDKEVAAAAKLLASDGGDAERAKQLAAGVAGLKAYADAVGPVLQQVVDAKIDSTAAYAYAGQALPELEQARSSFGKWLALTEAQVAANRETARSTGAMQSNLRLGAAALVMASFCGLMLLLSRSITRPLDQASEHARRITQGDLSAHITDDGRDEVTAFVHSLGEMQQSLRKIVGEVRTGADNIHTASAEVASGNLDLSQRTEHAASNLQQTAGAMEELTSMVRRSADAAANANQMAGAATEVAQRGGQVVAQVVSTMDEINAASRKISDIIGVIDGIAFQTNILALNAAVEAARAGEQGRGFAVVAGEVRSLAGRSAEAAREIKSLINASVERVDNGARLVRDAGSTMGDIVASVERVTEVIRDITSTTSQQSQGLGQINSAVSQLDQMTQQNAALVEESAAAAESLKSQAHRLVSVVADFKLAPAAQAAVPSPTARQGNAAKPPTAKPGAKPAPTSAPKPAPLAHKSAHEQAAQQAIVQARQSAASTPAPTTTAETLPELGIRQSAPARAASSVAASAPAMAAAGGSNGDSDWETF